MRKPVGKRNSVVGSEVSGFEDRPEKSSKLSLDEKRQLVHGIAQCLEDAPAVLSSFTRRELLEIICAEMGKERKYSGFTKSKMIEHLLKLVTKKSDGATSEKEYDSSQTLLDGNKSNRQQKNKYLCQLPKESERVPSEIAWEDPELLLLCENLACRAALDSEDSFCKRCSCCICYQYDDNKDPSLWLTCENGSLDEGTPCGISCHLKCALEQGKSGKVKKSSHVKVDGCFSCVYCGKLNDLMRSWRKQLVVATEARRVDALCLRLSFSYKILVGSEIYKELLKIVESAVATLENEVGPLDRASATMDRRIVNRLCCGTAVQKLCASAVEAFDSMSASYTFDHFSNDKDSPPACKIHFEELSPTRVTIMLDYNDRLLKDLYSCSLWHRRSKADYLEEPTYVVSRPTKRFELYNLDPSTEYMCRVSIYSKSRATIGSWEASWETPAISVKKQAEREYDAITYAQMRTESMNSSDSKVASSDHQPSMLLLQQDLENKSDDSEKKRIILPCVVSPPTNAPTTPCKSDGTKGVNNNNNNNNNNNSNTNLAGGKKQLKESDYEYSVRVIRKLEHEGYLEADFRVKFLTWFSLKATTQERRVVSVFIDTFLDDPPSLAGQLLDTFMDEICCEQKLLASSHGFCTRLWH